MKGVIDRHILKGLGGMHLIETCGVRDYLGQLPSSYGVVWQECIIEVPHDYATTGKAAHELIEGAVLRHVCELDGAVSRWARSELLQVYFQSCITTFIKILYSDVNWPAWQVNLADKLRFLRSPFV